MRTSSHILYRAMLCLALAAVLAGQNAEQQKRDLRVETEKQTADRVAGVVPRSYALVVGIGPYGKLPEKSWLKYSERDADAIYRILISPEGGNFRAENVHRLTGADATLENLTREIEEWLPAAAKPDDRVLIYFAGHGFVHEGRAYLAPYDFDSNAIAATGYPMDRLGEIVSSKIAAKDKILLTDACHSGAITPQLEGDNNEAINKSLLDLSSSMFLLSASRDRESSYESADWGGGHGIFTYYVVKAMEGEADETSDGIVTADELAEYVRYNVRRATNAMQTPTSDRGSFDPNMLLAYFPSRAPAAPVGQEERFGALVVTSNVDGVEVFLDGESQGVVGRDKPLRLPGLQPGTHSIKGVKMGYEPDGPREEVVYPGGEKSVNIKILYPRRPNRAAVDALDKGLEFYERGFEKNYRKAAEHFEQALAADPSYSRAAMFLGRAYANVYEYAQSRKAYERAIEIDPDFLEARASFGGMLLDTGDFDEAIRQLTVVAQREPDNFLAQHLLAHALHVKDVFDGSINAAEAAIRLDPDAAEPHLILADNLRLTERCREALPEYERYLALSDFQSSAAGKIFNYGLKGFFIGGGSKRRAAQKDIWTTLRVRTYMGIGDCERLLSDPDPAIRNYKKALELAPDDAIAHFGLALAYTHKTEITGDVVYLPDAREHFEAVVRLNPHLAEAERSERYISKIGELLESR